MKKINLNYDNIAEMLSAHNHNGENNINKIKTSEIANISIKLVNFFRKYDDTMGPIFDEHELINLDRNVIICLCIHYMNCAYDMINEVKFTNKSCELFKDIKNMALEYNVLYAILSYKDYKVTFYIHTVNDNGSGMKYHTKEDFMVEISSMIDDFIANHGTDFEVEVTANASCFSSDEESICPYKEPNIPVRHGQSGSNVKWVQWKLRKCGYQVKITGKFTKDLIDAVIRFQLDHGITADGIVGNKTIFTLNRACE